VPRGCHASMEPSIIVDGNDWADFYIYFGWLQRHQRAGERWRTGRHA
jgi:hypothetical protein